MQRPRFPPGKPAPAHHLIPQPTGSWLVVVIDPAEQTMRQLYAQEAVSWEKKSKGDSVEVELQWGIGDGVAVLFIVLGAPPTESVFTFEFREPSDASELRLCATRGPMGVLVVASEEQAAEAARHLHAGERMRVPWTLGAPVDPAVLAQLPTS